MAVLEAIDRGLNVCLARWCFVALCGVFLWFCCVVEPGFVMLLLCDCCVRIDIFVLLLRNCDLFCAFITLCGL